MAAMGCSEANTASKLRLPLQRDFAEQILLRHHHRLHPHHLQDGQKQRDHGAAGALPLEDAQDEDRLVLARLEELVAEVADHVRPP